MSWADVAVAIPTLELKVELAGRVCVAPGIEW